MALAGTRNYGRVWAVPLEEGVGRGGGGMGSSDPDFYDMACVFFFVCFIFFFIFIFFFLSFWVAVCRYCYGVFILLYLRMYTGGRSEIIREGKRTKGEKGLERKREDTEREKKRENGGDITEIYMFI